MKLVSVTCANNEMSVFRVPREQGTGEFTFNRTARMHVIMPRADFAQGVSYRAPLPAESGLTFRTLLIRATEAFFSSYLSYI